MYTLRAYSAPLRGELRKGASNIAIYHCHIAMVSGGRSAVAAAAYRSGDDLHDERYDRRQDYRQKGGVVHSKILLPDNAPREYLDRETLWNSAQNAERNNGQYAREIECALPAELVRKKQIELCDEYAMQFVKKGMCVDYSIHDKGDGNPHVHFLMTTRAIDEKGRWMQKEQTRYKLDENGEKIPVLDQHGKQKIGAKGRKCWQRETVKLTDWDDPANAEKWRESWATLCNDRLPPWIRVNHQSYARQGFDRVPTIHEGYAARVMEKRGEVSERCQLNRELEALNAARLIVEEEKRALIVSIAHQRREESIRRMHEEIREIRNYGGGKYDKLANNQELQTRAGAARKAEQRRVRENLIRRADKSGVESLGRNQRRIVASLGRTRYLPDLPFVDMGEEAPGASVLLSRTFGSDMEIIEAERMRDFSLFSQDEAGRNRARAATVKEEKKMGILGKLEGANDAPRMVEGQKWDTRKEKWDRSDDEDEEEETLMDKYVYRAPAVEDTTPIFGIEDDEKDNPADELADLVKKAASIEKGRADALQIAKETFLQNGIPAVALANAFQTILRAAEHGDRDAAAFLEKNESRLPTSAADFGKLTHKQRVDSIIKRDDAQKAAARQAERAAQRVNVRVKERGFTR